MKAYIESVGLQAPGLEGWFDSQAVLKGEAPYQASELSPYSPGFLPPNERRRTTDTIKLALRTAENTVSGYSQDEISSLQTLFACVDGDTQVSAKMTTAILQDVPMISPIHFHNSVHNAPAGYWMIGQKNQAAASSISAGQYQIANTLLEAMSSLSDDMPKIVVIWYDLPVDPILEIFQPNIAPFGCGLVLSQDRTERTLAQIDIVLEQTHVDTPENEWFGNNMAANCLPLLQAIAKQVSEDIYYPASSALSVKVSLNPNLI